RRSGRRGLRRSRRCRSSQTARHPSFGQVLDGQQALEDPLVEACLAELGSMQDRLHAFPSLLEKVEQRGVRGSTVEVLERVEDAGRPVDAEAALARAHPKSNRPADVVETTVVPVRDPGQQPLARYQLALADDL